MNRKSKFSSEAMLCLTFIRHLPEGWKAYPETCGFDIVLLRDDGVQVGIEAKLTLNAKVISQIREGYWDVDRAGPDFRAVLVPYGCAGSLGPICSMLGITVIEMMDKETYEEGRRYVRGRTFDPGLPNADQTYWGAHTEWQDWAPMKRLSLPDYVPDVKAGSSAPVKLTPWKVKAIKIAITVERRGYVTRLDFKHHQLDHRRWLDKWVGWLVQGERRGVYVAGPKLGAFKAQHPKNYEQIAADYEKWRTPDDLAA